MPNTTCSTPPIAGITGECLGMVSAGSVPPQYTALVVTSSPIVKNRKSEQQQQQQLRGPYTPRPNNGFQQGPAPGISVPTYPSTVDWETPIQETDFLYRKQISNLRQRKAGATRLSIFDFDNTLFKSPLPNPRIWDSTLIGMLKSTDLGWFHDSRTLDKPYLKYTRNHWIKETVAQVRSEVKKSDSTIIVLLTGRAHSSYRPLILDLVSRNSDLYFDLVVLKETPTRQSPLMSQGEFSDLAAARAATPLTFEYKMGVIEDIISAFPDISDIQMWDDRINHCQKMQTYLDSLRSRTTDRFNEAIVYYVPPQTIFMDMAKERNLVRSMVSAHNDHVHERASACGLAPDDKDYSVGTLQTQSRLAHVDVSLSPKSSSALQKEVRSPFGWMTEANHMMLVNEGEDSEAVLENELGAKDGDKVTIVVDCIGTIPGSTIAVRVSEVKDMQGNVLKPRLGRDEAVAYITVAYNGVEGFRLSRSDKIKRWRPLASGGLVLDGTIGKHYLTAASLVMPKPVINEVSIGRLVCHYWPDLRGKEIGNKISEINQRLADVGIENMEENKDKIENIVKSHAFTTQEQELPL
ncbi:hypothetical protein EV178_003819 [Coemansia sp. RSA 1646]|nr:hypothetical protein EV178_003819 [Coemansia sp. RSA 1646]